MGESQKRAKKGTGPCVAACPGWLKSKPRKLRHPHTPTQQNRLTQTTPGLRATRSPRNDFLPSSLCVRAWQLIIDSGARKPGPKGLWVPCAASSRDCMRTTKKKHNLNPRAQGKKVSVPVCELSRLHMGKSFLLAAPRSACCLWGVKELGRSCNWLWVGVLDRGS